ncbi:class I SAM-dependent methyltransferase [Geomonas sp. Red69]|uniref:class I SAM-dependent methyltransferase n=1 Tax=Geomonas diazotrophica TaxID=2843197 RepID=UPI001C125E00|nr:class I SAM-dependent methyltransferase [Geomonas diazotrophica]MBU5637910.1 class I SAM-dependent methyltransferase [Geomonas diazotrophica]
MTMQMKCSTCGTPLKSQYPAVQDPITRETFSIEACEICGLGHTSPQPEDLGRYYSYPYYGNRHGFTARYCTRRRLRFLRSAVSGAPGRLLDIGCGDGAFLLGASAAGWQVAGTELNPEPARRAGFEVADSLDRISGAGLFDCITMWHTLEHMRDVRWTLAQVDRLLKPDGRLIIAVPDFGGVQARLFGPKWLHADVPRHLFHFTDRALTGCLRAAGFLVRQRWHQEFEYDLLGWSQSALNCIQSEPDLFFNQIAGKKVRSGAGARIVSLMLGTIFTALALPVLVASTLSHRGGSLIVVAQRTPLDLHKEVAS